MQCVILNEKCAFFLNISEPTDDSILEICLGPNHLLLAMMPNFGCIFLVQSNVVCMQQGIFDLGAKRAAAAAAALLVLSQHRSREESHLFVALGILSKLIDEVASLVRPLLP